MSRQGHPVATTAELPAGARKVVTVKGREILLVNHQGRYSAILNKCPHQGAALSRGMFVTATESDGPGDYRRGDAQCLLRCPWHGWTFDIDTGKSWCEPEMFRMRKFDVAVGRVGDPAPGEAAVALELEKFETGVSDDLIYVYL